MRSTEAIAAGADSLTVTVVMRRNNSQISIVTKITGKREWFRWKESILIMTTFMTLCNTSFKSNLPLFALRLRGAFAIRARYQTLLVTWKHLQHPETAWSSTLWTHCLLFHRVKLHFLAIGIYFLVMAISFFYFIDFHSTYFQMYLAIIWIWYPFCLTASYFWVKGKKYRKYSRNPKSFFFTVVY